MNMHNVIMLLNNKATNLVDSSFPDLVGLNSYTIENQANAILARHYAYFYKI